MGVRFMHEESEIQLLASTALFNHIIMTPGVILWCSRFFLIQSSDKCLLDLKIQHKHFSLHKALLNYQKQIYNLIFCLKLNIRLFSNYFIVLLLFAYMLVFSGIDEFLWGHKSTFVILLSYYLVHVWC